MKLLSFLQDVGPDHRGRFLSDIWKFSDDDIEHTHDFIQWVFPLDEPSGAQPDAPVLEPAEIDLIHKSGPATMNVERSTEWFLGFLSRSQRWLVPHDHNHLRITRMIKSNRLLLGELAAESARAKVLKLVQKAGGKISEESIAYWRSA
jgi:hypothetical protein